MIYLGKSSPKINKGDSSSNNNNDILSEYKVMTFYVILKNNEIVTWYVIESLIKNYINRGWLKITNRKKIPPELLKEIRLQREKEAVNIVSEETSIKLPTEIKNKLLVALGQDEGKDYFSQEPNTKEKQEAGEKKSKKQKRNSKKSRKRKHKKSKKILSKRVKKTKK
jgi:hypothetical protein